MHKILKIKCCMLLFLLFLALSQSNAYTSRRQSTPPLSILKTAFSNREDTFMHTPHFFAPRNKTDIDDHKAEKHLLTVQNEDSLKKTRIKKRMQYIDKILEEIDRILYTEEMASAEVLKKIKRLLQELERLRRNRDL
jgi:hypothetical protein